MAREGASRVVKALDVAASLAGLLVLLIPGAPIALIVRLSFPGPALFVQTRVGRHGRPFRCVKRGLRRRTQPGARGPGRGTRAQDIPALGRDGSRPGPRPMASPIPRNPIAASALTRQTTDRTSKSLGVL